MPHAPALAASVASALASLRRPRGSRVAVGALVRDSLTDAGLVVKDLRWWDSDEGPMLGVAFGPSEFAGRFRLWDTVDLGRAPGEEAARFVGLALGLSEVA